MRWYLSVRREKLTPEGHLCPSVLTSLRVHRPPMVPLPRIFIALTAPPTRRSINSCTPTLRTLSEPILADVGRISTGILLVMMSSTRSSSVGIPSTALPGSVGMVQVRWGREYNRLHPEPAGGPPHPRSPGGVSVVGQRFSPITTGRGPYGRTGLRSPTARGSRTSRMLKSIQDDSRNNAWEFSEKGRERQG